jgi:hypothetical protein
MVYDRFVVVEAVCSANKLEVRMEVRMEWWKWWSRVMVTKP